MGILKRATGDVKSIDLGDGDFLTVKSDVSKREFNSLLNAMPKREISEESGLTLQEGIEVAEQLFATLVVGWSVGSGTPTLEDYLSLTPEASMAVDSALIEHFNDIAPTKDELSKVSTSPAKAPRGSQHKR